MSFERRGGNALEYFPYRLAGSKQMFRGPKASLSGAYTAILGGTEVYGKFIPRPFADILRDTTGIETLNMGVPNAGIDQFLGDDAVLKLCRGADTTVVQVLGAHNLSNRFYTVHPRRNDRFLKASEDLRALYPEVDFVRFHFTRHLLMSLEECCPKRFATVRAELQKVWVARMRALMDAIPGRKILLWLSERAPSDAPVNVAASDPVLVNKAMLKAVARDSVKVVEVVAQMAARHENLFGMIYDDLDALVAAEMPGPAFHLKVADALDQCLTPA